MFETENLLHLGSAENRMETDFSAALMVRVGEEDETSYECCRTY